MILVVARALLLQEPCCCKSAYPRPLILDASVCSITGNDGSKCARTGGAQSNDLMFSNADW